MAWKKSNWFDLIGTDAGKQSINPGQIKEGDINCAGTPPFLKVSVKAAIVFGTSVNAPVDIEIYGLDASKANERDTVPIWEQSVHGFSSAESRVTIPNLDVAALDSLRIMVRNNSSSLVSVWVSYYAAYIA